MVIIHLSIIIYFLNMSFTIFKLYYKAITKIYLDKFLFNF